MKIRKSQLKQLIKEVIQESDASEEANKKNLIYVGFGHWKNKAGKIVASTVDGKLEPIKDELWHDDSYHTKPDYEHKFKLHSFKNGKHHKTSYGKDFEEALKNQNK